MQNSSWFLDDVVFPVVFVDLEFGHGALLHADAGPMDRLGGAGDQRVPVEKRFALPQEFVGTGFRHPVEVLFHVRRAQHDAFWHELVPDFILAATTGGVIEQAAGDSCQDHLAGILILKLVHATLAAAVAERLPLPVGHARQWFRFPEAWRETAPFDRIVAAHRVARISRARVQSASICMISASRLSNFSSGRRNSTSPTDSVAP